MLSSVAYKPLQGDFRYKGKRAGRRLGGRCWRVNTGRLWVRCSGRRGRWERADDT